MQRRSYRLGDILLEMAFIDPATLREALASIAPTAAWLCGISGAISLYYPGPVGTGPGGAAERFLRLGEVLVDLKLLTEPQLQEILRPKDSPV